MPLTARIRVSGTRSLVVGKIRNLPAILSGKKRDSIGAGELFRSTFTHTFFTRLFNCYMDKTTGGTDEFGHSWPPLKQETIAQRPLTTGQRRFMGIEGKRERGLLTPEQNRLWKAIFRSTLGRLLRQAVPIAEAKEAAGRTAWAVLKARGAKTKLHTLGTRNVPILRVTDRLVDSLSPGRVSSHRYIPFNRDQIAKWQAQEFTFGTKVPYAVHVHKTRPLWPIQHEQARWHQAGLSAGRDAMLKLLVAKGLPNA